MQYRILSLDDNDQDAQSAIQEGLSASMHIDCVTTTKEAIKKLRESLYDILLLDKHLEKEQLYGVDLIPKFKSEFPNVAIIIVTQDRNFGGVLPSLHLGASDYVVKSPFLVSDLQIRIPTAIDGRKRLQFSSNQTHFPTDCPLVGSSFHLATISSSLRELTNSNGNIIIEASHSAGGITLAKQAWEQRNDPLRPVVYLDLNAIPKEAHETILFGDNRNQLSAFIKANGGDLIIHNIDLLTSKLQSRLIQTIKKQRLNNPNSTFEIPIQVRTIVIDPNPIDKKIKSLFKYTFKIPPLAKRPEDIHQIVLHYLEKAYSGRKIEITPQALKYLSSRRWIGNFQQLSNTIDVAVNSLEIHDNNKIDILHVSSLSNPNSLESRQKNRDGFIPQFISDITKNSFSNCLNDVEKNYLESAIHLCNGDLKKLAEYIGISTSTLYEKLDRLKIDRNFIRKLRSNARKGFDHEVHHSRS